MDYNTQRPKLTLPEYGRYIQEMVAEAKKIENKEKRSQQVKAIVNVMGILNPQMRDGANYKHKLWDHLYAIADYDLDIEEAPFACPVRKEQEEKPHEIHLETTPLRMTHYGRNIQNMVKAIAAKPEGSDRDAYTLALAHYMRKQYLIWNKDTVADQTIFNDIYTLSDGLLKVPEGTHLSELRGEFKPPVQSLQMKAAQNGFPQQNWSSAGKKRKKNRK